MLSLLHCLFLFIVCSSHHLFQKLFWHTHSHAHNKCALNNKEKMDHTHDPLHSLLTHSAEKTEIGITSTHWNASLSAQTHTLSQHNKKTVHFWCTLQCTQHSNTCWHSLFCWSTHTALSYQRSTHTQSHLSLCTMQHEMPLLSLSSSTPHLHCASSSFLLSWILHSTLPLTISEISTQIAHTLDRIQCTLILCWTRAFLLPILQTLKMDLRHSQNSSHSDHAGFSPTQPNLLRDNLESNKEEVEFCRNIEHFYVVCRSTALLLLLMHSQSKKEDSAAHREHKSLLRKLQLFHFWNCVIRLLPTQLLSFSTSTQECLLGALYRSVLYLFCCFCPRLPLSIHTLRNS